MLKNVPLMLLAAALVMMAIPTKSQSNTVDVDVDSDPGSSENQGVGVQCETHVPKFTLQDFLHHLTRYDTEMKKQGDDFKRFETNPPQTEAEWAQVGVVFERGAKTYFYEAYELAWIIETILTGSVDGFAKLDIGDKDCDKLHDVSLRLPSFLSVQALDAAVGAAVLEDFKCFARLFADAEVTVDPNLFKGKAVTIGDVFGEIGLMLTDMYKIIHSGNLLHEAHKKIEGRYAELSVGVNGDISGQATKRNLERIVELLGKLKGSSKLSKLLRRK